MGSDWRPKCGIFNVTKPDPECNRDKGGGTKGESKLKMDISGNMSRFYWYKTSGSSVPVRTGRSEHINHRKPHDHTFEHATVDSTGLLAGRRNPDADWRHPLPRTSSPQGTRGRSLASTEDCRH